MAGTMVPGLAVHPGTPHSVHMTEIPLPAQGPKDVLIRVRRAGCCATDREIIEGLFGSAPTGFDNLVIGHEVLGVVESVGPHVSDLQPGDFVTVTARRGCDCAACRSGHADFCSALGYKERGIIGLHGYMTTRFVEDQSQVVKVPAALESVGVMVEPFSVAEKAWRVATAVQHRLPGWTPRVAVVYGAGPIGLMSTLILRARGLDVYTFDLKPADSAAAEIVRACGATYLCTASLGPAELRRDLPPIDLIIECTGSSIPVLNAMEILGNNGVLVLLSITGGGRELTVPMDRLNLEFILGNKIMVGSVNSSLADFRAAIDDLERASSLWPGLAERLITKRMHGLEAGLRLPEAMLGEVKAVIELE